MKKIIVFMLAISLCFSALTGCGKDEKDNTFNTLSDLKGKVVATIGKGNSPDFVFRYLLKENGLEFVESDIAVEGKVALRYAENGAQAAGFVLAGSANFAALAEPQMSDAAEKLGRKVVFNLQTEYDKLAKTQGGYPQAILMVKNSALENGGKTVKAAVDKIATSEKFLTNDIAGGVEKLKAAGAKSVDKLSSGTVERSGIGFKKAAKADLEKYFNIVITDLAAIGGKMPSDSFYFSGEFNDNTAAEKLKVFAPDGAPALALSPLIGDPAFTVAVIAAKEIAPKMLKNEGDIIIMPSNAAANLFNKGTTGYTFVGVTSFGNMYII